MSQTIILPADPPAIEQAAHVLRDGGTVVFPTDTVYGVGANLFSEKALEALFNAKGRSSAKAIPVLISSPDCIAQVAREIPETATRLMKHFWPGGLTIVMKKRPEIPEILTGGMPTVAVRMPDHKVALQLISRAGGAVAATSANRAGESSPVTAQEAIDQLLGRVDIILVGGSCPGGVVSSIVDLSAGNPRLLRAGAIQIEELEQVMGRHFEQV